MDDSLLDGTLFLTISAGDQTLAKEGLNRFTCRKKTNSVPDDYSPLNVTVYLIEIIK